MAAEPKKPRSPEKQSTTSLYPFLEGGSDSKLREFVALMYAASSRLQSMRRELARSVNLGMTDLSVLLAVYGSNGSSGMRVKDIADTLHVAAANVTASLNTLEKGGWIKKRTHPKDSRVVLVELTTEGGARLDRLSAKLRNVNDAWFKGISEEEYALSRQFLLRLIEQYDSAFHVARLENWESET